MTLITLPPIHLNGTSPEVLRESYSEAYVELSRALRKLENVEFNARDYYPIAGAWAKAQSEHASRLTRIYDVCKEIAQIVDHCTAEIDAKAKRDDERNKP